MSRTLTDTESRYSHIEREALSAEFVTSKLQMYLLGAPRFQLATDHKHFLPLFNNPTAKLAPRIERLGMNIQNRDFDMIHIPGKTNMTDNMSRQEKHLRAVIETDHAVVMDKIKQETAKDQELRD